MNVGREVEIALVLSPDGWVEQLHRHCADHGGARVRCMVVEPSIALEESFDVLVVSERWPALTRPFVDAIHAQGRRVLVVADGPPPDGSASARLGVDRLVAVTASPEELVASAVALAPPDRTQAVGPATMGAAEVAVSAPPPPCPAPIVVVGGPFGAGSTEVALGLASAAARHGRSSVLFDADGVTPSVAVRLGLPLEPNLCTAVDAVAYGLGAVPGALFDLGRGWPAVLVGAPSRAAAAGLAAPEVIAVAEVLAARYTPVVCDVSAANGPGGPVESIATALLTRAAHIVAVGAANPVGLVRLLEWTAAVAAIGDAARLEVVVNRAPADRARRAELASEVRRHAGVARVTFVPTDPRVEHAAWDATVAERGPFARESDALWARVASALARRAESGRA